jgi:hypothetical protein
MLRKKRKGIDPQTDRAADYSKIFGYCSACGAPIWFNRIIDNMGTPLLAYHCWNGHYHTLEAQVLDIYLHRKELLTPMEIKRILPFIKFIRLSS